MPAVPDKTNILSFPAAVIDASFIAAYLLGIYTGKGESAEQGFEKARNYIRAVIEQNGQFFVPHLFFYEIGNILQTVSRKGKNGTALRISMAERQEIEYDLFEFPIITDSEDGTALMMRVQELADEHTLSFYDASYLELSHRLQLPLLTFDKSLRKAADIISVH
jgi:predicted nucleic acid-binding protein